MRYRTLDGDEVVDERAVDSPGRSSLNPRSGQNSFFPASF
jgi:hypothetical protein